MEITIDVQDEQEAAAFRMLVAERRRQDNKFGKQDHDPAWWMVIMGEEYGETCQAVCEYRWAEALPDAADRMARIKHAVDEASQVGAVAVAMIQSVLRGEWRDEITTVLPSDRRQVAKALGWGAEAVRYDDVVEEKAISCYHCGLNIREINGVWTHSSIVKYMDWLQKRGGKAADFEHKARYEPECVKCGRDNANGTHNALERTGHLDHSFTLTQDVAVPGIESAGIHMTMKGNW